MSNATSKTYTLIWNNPRSQWHRQLYVHFIFRPEGQVDIVYKRCWSELDQPEKYKTLHMGYDDPATGAEIRLELRDGNSCVNPVKTLPVDHARALWKYMTRLVVKSPEDTGWTRTTEYESR